MPTTIDTADTTEQRRPPTPIGPAGGHEPALDGIRLFAFLGVFLLHAGVLPMFILLPLGKSGITAFFVLSGFLIGGILLNARDSHAAPLWEKFRTFYARRSLRIFPVYYFVLAISTILAAAGLRELHYAWTDPWDWLYLINAAEYSVREIPGAQAHLWTLAVEEQFYLVAPLVILALGNRKLSWICVLVWVCGAVWRSRTYIDQYGAILPWTQLDPLTLGLAAAILQQQGRFLRITPRMFGKAGVVCGILAVPSNIFPWAVTVGGFDFHLGEAATRKLITVSQTVDQWLLGAAVAALILAFWNGSGGVVRRFFGARPIAYLGKISYGLYLYHLFVLVICQTYVPFLKDRVGLCAVVALVLTVIVSVFSWHVIELPINEMKRLFPYPNHTSAVERDGEKDTLLRGVRKKAAFAMLVALLVVGLTAVVAAHR